MENDPFRVSRIKWMPSPYALPIQRVERAWGVIAPSLVFGSLGFLLFVWVLAAGSQPLDERLALSIPFLCLWSGVIGFGLFKLLSTKKTRIDARSVEIRTQTPFKRSVLIAPLSQYECVTKLTMHTHNQRSITIALFHDDDTRFVQLAAFRLAYHEQAGQAHQHFAKLFGLPAVETELRT